MTDENLTVEMSDGELDAYLAQPLLARIATARDNRPHVTPIWFLWDGSILWCETNPDFKKARNLKKNAECAVVIDSTEGGLRNRGVILEGQAQLILEPRQRVMDIVSQIYERYMGAEARCAPTVKEMYDSPHVLIKLVPRRIISWNWKRSSISPLL